MNTNTIQAVVVVVVVYNRLCLHVNKILWRIKIPVTTEVHMNFKYTFGQIQRRGRAQPLQVTMCLLCAQATEQEALANKLI